MKKGKCVVNEIDKLKTKRQHMENGMSELNKWTDDFFFNAKKKRDLLRAVLCDVLEFDFTHSV